jgi:hypothetical protein
VTPFILFFKYILSNTLLLFDAMMLAAEIHDEISK